MPHRAHPERRLSRLDGYDYRRGGWYFVTICTKDRALLFGDVVDGAMKRNVLGEIASAQWEHTLALRPYLEEDAFVVMPNHVHLLFGLRETGTTAAEPTMDLARHVPTDGPARRFGKPVGRSVSSTVGAYKSAVTREVNGHRGRTGGTIWQARFHDRIVRDEREHERIRRYIIENPLRWHLDRYHP